MITACFKGTSPECTRRRREKLQKKKKKRGFGVRGQRDTESPVFRDSESW
jgi:hypothetical protein